MFNSNGNPNSEWEFILWFDMEKEYSNSKVITNLKYPETNFRIGSCKLKFGIKRHITIQSWKGN